MRLLPTVERLIETIGLMPTDCHRGLPRNTEYRGLGLGGGAISIEEGMLLVGLAWSIKPNFIIELGTSKAASSLFLAAALADIGRGHVITVDTADSIPNDAYAIQQKLMLPLRFVNKMHSIEFLDSFEVHESLQYLVFSDTEISVRPKEVAKVLAKYPKGTIIAVHDTSDLHPRGPMRLRQELAGIVGRSFEVVQIPSPRGLSLLEVL